MSAREIARELGGVSIDFSKRFAPERFLPLAYAPIYGNLSDGERLRYNQLHGLYVNEQIAFFETVLARNVLLPLIRRTLPEDLRDALRRFVAEEDTHTEMFRQLNRRAAPHLFGARDARFIRAGRPLRCALARAARHARTLPLFIWMMLIQEEKAAEYARDLIRDSADVEPSFLRVHRRHLADEMDHIQWDELLLDRLWERLSPRLRRWNARLLAWLLGEFFLLPKRGGWRVIEEWVREFPARRPLLPEIRRQLAALGDEPRYLAAVYSRELSPRAYARFDRCPEFRILEKARVNYRPLETPAL
ncbi:MAG: diiron oxygenase [Planctomycetes bacterium]|nr:diiron oxygenase [Planctomycetota bacterium]